MLVPDVVKRFRITDGASFRLADYNPADTGGVDLTKDAARDLLKEGVKRLSDLQERLYAQDRWAILLIFQAMDAAGKDSAIKHVMSGLNPQGCQVHSFKAPSAQELDHDFLWRTTVALPERGRIGIFNRSYYEEVLVVRIHPEILGGQKLPSALVTGDIWRQRFGDIVAFKSYLARNGIVPLKFFLHVSKDEQRKRFLERIEDPEKWWKFSARDVAERALWDRYMEAYEDAIRHTATAAAPWHVVPADKKWFTRLLVAATIAERLEAMELQFPKVDAAAQHGMKAAKAALLAEGKAKTKAKQKPKTKGRGQR